MSNTIGVTYAKGFRSAGVACGLKKTGAADLALVVSDTPAAAAGMFTRNIVKGHSLQLAQKNVANGQAQAVVINSGNANACLAERGTQDAMAMAAFTAECTGCAPEDVLTGSTGVIGLPMPMDKIKSGILAASKELSYDGGHQSALAIMTTDTIPKEAGIEINIGGTAVRIGAMAKGSGMIHINMATMISVITTDACISADALKCALHQVVEKTYNCVTVDGDTSVCDKVIILANGAAGNAAIEQNTPEYDAFVCALTQVAETISRMLAADGEGASKLLTIKIKNAPTYQDAKLIAQAIAKSPLCKTAAYGEDANWGRLLTAAGYSGAQFDPEKVDIFIGELQVCKNGGGLDFSEEEALKILKEKEVVYTLDFICGEGNYTAWTCDLSHDYVTINGSYRS